MAPKKKAQESGPDVSGGLQAVLIADSYEYLFRPVTCDISKCLLPLCGVPLLQHSLDFLERNNIKDVLLVHYGDTGPIEEHIKQWSCRKTMHIELMPLSRRAAMCFGDVIREIDDRDYAMHDDFILCYADTVCTANLEPVIQLHKQRRAANPMTLLTKLFVPTTATSRRRTAFDDSVVVYDASTCELICWQSLVDSSKFVLPNDVLKRNASGDRVQVRYDLTDFGVSICSSRVLKLFSESFDSLCFRKDFCHDILTKPIKLDVIYTHVLEPADSLDHLPFAARATDFRTMMATCFAIQERASFPVVLDGFAFDGVPLLISLGRASYKANSAQLHESATFGPHSVILSKSTVGAQSKLSHCVVGRHCRLGANCNLSKCVLLDNVVIEDDVVCENAFLSKGVVLRRGAKVASGAVLGSDVIIGENTHVPAHTRLGLYEEVAGKSPTASEDGLSASDEEDAEEHSSDAARELSTLFVPAVYRRLPDAELEERKAVHLVGQGGRGIEFISGSGQKEDSSNVLSLHCLGTPLDDHVKLWMPPMEIDSDDGCDDSVGDDDSVADTSQCPKDKNSNQMDATEFVRPGTIIDFAAKTKIGDEVRQFVESGLQRPAVMHHKIMEMKSFRLASGWRDIDVLCQIVAPIIDSCRDICLDFELWAERIKSNGGLQLFAAFLDDESEEAHFALYNVTLSYCVRAQTCAVVAAAGAPSAVWSSFESIGSLSFLLQLFARLEIVDDEITLMWHQQALKHLITSKGQQDDKTQVAVSLLSFGNLLEYVKWLEDS